MLITNKADWWDGLGSQWGNIQLILGRFVSNEEEESAKQAYKDRDEVEMLRVLNNAWWNASDDSSIHEIPGWGDMCDLCSESWVFDE